MNEKSQYRFAPWVRRGLASVIEPANPITGRAKITTGITVSSSLAGDGNITAGITLSLYGPGDILGIDPRLIVRTYPIAGANNAEDNLFAACDFDPPDFVWMFTPTKADGQQRLNPWLVLIVVSSAVAPPKVFRDRPLPVLTIPREIAAQELPDLKESWAWAHAQHVTSSDFAGDIARQLGESPDMNVSRLIAPRRLAPNEKWTACLVPAFEAGLQRGLGATELPGPDEPLLPAWDIDNLPLDDIKLPVYYHWAFATGPAGDFESLARQLKPFKTPDNVGVAPMYIGDPGDPLVLDEPLDDDEDTILMDGVLAAPGNANVGGDRLAEVPAGIKEGLQQLLNEPARRLEEDLEAPRIVAPPIYGQWHRQAHSLPEDSGDWLHELNVDPRTRVAAGLGAEVVRAYQEDFMQQSWEQVGEVLKANNKLNWGRLSLELSLRIFERHYKPLPTDRFLQMTAPVQRRTARQQKTVSKEVVDSSMPSAMVEPSFRRMTSPQRPLIRKTMRRLKAQNRLDADFNARGRSDLVLTMAAGSPRVDPTQFTPDGLKSSVLLEKVANDEPVRIKGIALDQAASKSLQSKINQSGFVERDFQKEPLTIRPRSDIDESGLVTAVQIDKLRELKGRSGQGTIRSTNIFTNVAELLKTAVENPDAGEVTVTTGTVGNVLSINFTVVNIAGGGGVVGGGGGVVGGGGGVIADEAESNKIPLPDKDDVEAISKFKGQFERSLGVLKFNEKPTSPELIQFPVDDVRVSLDARINPLVMVPRRVRQFVDVVEGNLWQDAVADGPVTLPPTNDRVIASPILPAPMYRYLDEAAPDRFLPGAGAIPADSITVLETNPRFIEAFMVGLNTEMNREYLWRKFPGNQNKTPFRRFWDRSTAQNPDGQDDIEPIDRWDDSLGSNLLAANDEGQLVLLLRGDLLRLYPNSVISIWKEEDGDLKEPTENDPVLLPVFQGKFRPDMTFAGFELTRDELKQGDGRFAVISQQPTDAIFGLDINTGEKPDAVPVNAQDATWDHTDVAVGEYIRLETNQSNTGFLQTLLGGNSAVIAANLFQKPVQVAIHADELILPE